MCVKTDFKFVFRSSINRLLQIIATKNKLKCCINSVLDLPSGSHFSNPCSAEDLKTKKRNKHLNVFPRFTVK